LTTSDDVILDIDFDSPAPAKFYGAPADNWQSAVAVEARAASRAATGDDIAWSTRAEDVVEWEGKIQAGGSRLSAPTPVQDLSDEAVRAVQEFPQPSLSAEGTTSAAAGAGKITLEQLSPEVIDAIARRAVELLSEKAVQEIAWEVVPQLAELLIKRKLEESK
jgi:hypothetical protein